MIYENSGVVRLIVEIIREELKNDREALKLAEKILYKYLKGGTKAVRDLVSNLIEGTENDMDKED